MKLIQYTVQKAKISKSQTYTYNFIYLYKKYQMFHYYLTFQDYWISVLYKAFVGPEVVPCVKASSDKVRLYCQCTNRNFKTSSVTCKCNISANIFSLGFQLTTATYGILSYHNKSIFFQYLDSI